MESDDGCLKKNPTYSYQQVEGDVGVKRGFHDARIAVPD